MYLLPGSMIDNLYRRNFSRRERRSRRRVKTRRKLLGKDVYRPLDGNKGRPSHQGRWSTNLFAGTHTPREEDSF